MNTKYVCCWSFVTVKVFGNGRYMSLATLTQTCINLQCTNMWMKSTPNCVVHLVSCRVKLNPPLNVNFYPDAFPAYLNDLKSYGWCSSRVSHDFSNTNYTCDVMVLSDDATADSSRSSRSPPNNLAKGWDFMRQREPWTSPRRAG